MEKKESKIKKFYKKNKDIITKIALLAGGAAVGCGSMVLAFHGKFTVTNDSLAKILADAQNEFGACKMTMFTGRVAESLTTDKLGEIGEEINSLGGKDNVFKYFIAIGPDKK